MMKRAVLLLAGLGVASFLASLRPPVISAEQPPAYFVDPATLPFDALSGTSTARHWGIQGGAGYRIEVPENWNGDLVVYAHGFRGQGLQLTVSNPNLRRYLVTNGFAWAASSYARNNYDVKQGVKDTHDLTNRFNALVGNPRRTYITGHSMGGHITGVAVEQYPNAYDGALPMCGVMGDAELFDYFLDLQLTAQALAGLTAEYPHPPDYATAIAPVLRAAFGAPYPFALTPLGLTYRAVVEQLTGGTRANISNAFAFWGNALLGFALPGDFGLAAGTAVGNIDTVYQMDNNPAMSADEAALNASVLRVSEDPQGRHPNGLANIPGISGRLSIPTLSMHTLGDLFVPFSMEQIYRTRADAQGASQMLVQRAYRDIGHCVFNVVEEEESFAALVNWVENGVKPAGDDVIDRTVIANPQYGCQFTRTTRAGYAACPVGP
jgi:pimeloyl-ACP methyl ester carboxylesterase